jgi:hypothetical protein
MVLITPLKTDTLDDINGDGVDDLTTPLLKMLHTVLHLTQVY